MSCNGCIEHAHSPGGEGDHARFATRAAACTLIGALASGPLAVLVAQLSHPQPAWQGARAFAEHYHVVQTLPFFFGLLLVAGFVLLIAALHAGAPAALRARTGAALAFAAAFASLVLFNYAVQTTFVPGLVEPFVPASAPLVTAFSMTNPRSLGWSLEMWGYGWLGVATWLIAPVFSRSRLERVTARLFVANGPLSLSTALWTALQPGWVMTGLGLLGYVLWNVLIVVMAALSLAALRARTRNATGARPPALEPAQARARASAQYAAVARCPPLNRHHA